MSAVRKVSGLVSIKHASIRDASTRLKAERVHARDATGLKLVFSAMAATATPEEDTGYKNAGTVKTVIVGPFTVSATGGAAPYTYAWSRTAPDAQPWTINSPTAATTTFSSNCDAGESFTATFICTVTDSTGATAVSNPVSATAVNLGGGLL